MTLRLGVIGYSDGNGHPYSWSAIFNGFDYEGMRESGYPVILDYLSKQDWPAAQLEGGRVTAVWTQDIVRSRSIARAARIPTIAPTLEDLVDQVDAVLLARDDAENHMRYARLALEAGKPIYIDKPIACSVSDMEMLYALEKYPGQIFTCSALRYAKELTLSQDRLTTLGAIREIRAVTPKSWAKYAVHIIEPVVKLLGADASIDRFEATHAQDEQGVGEVSVRWTTGVVTMFKALGHVNSNIEFHVLGEHGEHKLVFADSFSAFKSALTEFLAGIALKDVRSSKEFNLTVVRVIEAGFS